MDLENIGVNFVKKVKSKVDNTVKFIFTSQGQIIEFSFIDKKDGKDIICVPSQTSCRLGCKFCFLTDFDLKVRNLASAEIVAPINHVIENLNLLSKPNHNDVLLISFMGCGEPLLNLKNVIGACEQIRNKYSNQYKIVRFAIASLIPTIPLMENCIRMVKERDLMVKFHLSLHSPCREVRREIMPGATSIEESINQVKLFKHITGNSTEIHYALIDGVNDREIDLKMLIELLQNSEIPVKFLVYNKKPSVEFEASKRVEYFRKALEKRGIETEFYIPPGRDVGSSCGQFLMDYYEQFNTKSTTSQQDNEM